MIWILRSGDSGARTARKSVRPGSVSQGRPPSKLVGLGGFEPPTRSLGNCCSIHLSYSPTSEVIVARGFGVSALGRHRHSLQVLNFLLNVSLAATSKCSSRVQHCCDARWPGWFCGPRPTRAGSLRGHVGVSASRATRAAKCRVRNNRYGTGRRVEVLNS